MSGMIEKVARVMFGLDHNLAEWGADYLAPCRASYRTKARILIKEVFPGVKETECESCGTRFLVGKGTGRRNSAKFCSDKCRKRTYRAKKGWLGRQFEEAQKEIESWPDWMQKAAKFEGSNRG